MGSLSKYLNWPRWYSTTKCNTLSGQSKLPNSFSIKSAMAFIYPSRWYQEGITVCCMFTRYSSSLTNERFTIIKGNNLNQIINQVHVHSLPKYTLQQSKAWTASWYWKLWIQRKHNKLCNTISFYLQQKGKKKTQYKYTVFSKSTSIVSKMKTKMVKKQTIKSGQKGWRHTKQRNNDK